MSWVKICGITNLEDALTAVDAGADALGFVFYEKSPRRIGPEVVREIVKKVPENVEKVGVFVDDDWERVVATTQEAGLSAMQLHFGESNLSACRALAPTTVKMFVATPAARLLAHPSGLNKAISLLGSLRSVDAVFLDSCTAEMPGGTGKTFDWVSARDMVACIGRTFRVVIAGGLNPANVAEAMRTLHPWGIDVASGVEASPGKKDPAKVRAFIAAVRAADKID